MHRVITKLLLLFTILISLGGVAQNVQSKVANEYFNKRDYEKAYSYYKKIIKQNSERPYIYQNYIATARKLSEQKAALQVLNKFIKESPASYEYKVDKAILLKDLGKEQDYKKLLDRLFIEGSVNSREALKLSNILTLRKLTGESIKLLLISREDGSNEFLHAEELATLYKNSGKKKEMLTELLNLLELSSRKIQTVQNGIQQELQSKKDYEEVTTMIFERIDGNNKIEFNELLVWMYIQQKDFYNAFVQQRSIDKRSPDQRGKQLIELGDIAVKNKDYKNAERIYQYVTENYPNEYHYVSTKRKLIQTKEIREKDKYPADSAAIAAIIVDYDELLSKSRLQDENARIKINKAELYAQYLSNIPKALEQLNEVSANPRVSKRLKNEAKLLLGDIYILKEETGDAMLQYMQVERAMEDDVLGHQAKLKTAKVSYYEAEFELAQAHLDILKRATQRKIANDAQDLSLLIKSNLALDTSAEALSAFAKTELLTYQKKFSEALRALDEINVKFPGHSLKDEIHYQKAQIYLGISEYSKAVRELQKIEEMTYDVLTDDAVFLLGKIYEENLADKVKAKEYYKKILIDFSGSIHVAEARKRFREI